MIKKLMVGAAFLSLIIALPVMAHDGPHNEIEEVELNTNQQLGTDSPQESNENPKTIKQNKEDYQFDMHSNNTMYGSGSWFSWMIIFPVIIITFLVLGIFAFIKYLMGNK